MRLLIITQFFEPEPTLKGLAFARRLTEYGHQVQVLTGFPNYPGGKVYEGYKIRPYQKEEIDGVTVHRVALYPSHDRSSLRRMLNYFSFAASASFFGIFKTGQVDAIYVYHPPLTTSIPARLLKFLKRAPFIYDIHDMWPDTLGATGMMSKPALIKLIGNWCLRVYRSAGRVVVVSPGFRRLLIDRGVPESKLSLSYAWCEEDRLHPEAYDPALAEELGLAGKFNVMFAGTIGLAQGLDAVLEAARLVKQKAPQVQFAIVGEGVELERLKQRTVEMDLSNVLFVPRQPMERMGKILPLADVLLVHLRDDPLFHITVPAKTMAYFYCGVPVIMGVRGDAADLIKNSGAGVTCEPGDPESLAEAVLSMTRFTADERSEMGKAGRAFYDRELSMEAGVRKFDALFRELAAERGVTPRRAASSEVGR